jgi:rfaE bifunctional protein nucleotidyltransferase chain/domain
MKIIEREFLTGIVNKHKIEKKTLVFTNGCFDILHAGHVRYLSAAKDLGDILIVGLNSDSSVTALKGAGRPINSEGDRAEVLAALAAVDYVVIFADATAENLVADILPDVYVKGGDYTTKELPEAKIVAKGGGRTVLIPEVPGRSTSNIVRAIHNS